MHLDAPPLFHRCRKFLVAKKTPPAPSLKFKSSSTLTNKLQVSSSHGPKLTRDCFPGKKATKKCKSISKQRMTQARNDSLLFA